MTLIKDKELNDMSNMTDQELLEYYYMIKAKFEKCVHWKYNPYKRVTHEAFMELMRRGLK